MGRISSETSLEELCFIFKSFEMIYNRIPTSTDCNKTNDLPQWQTVQKILKNNNIKLKDFYIKLGKTSYTRSNIEDYLEMVELYKKISNEKGSALKYRELFYNEYSLPSSRWFITHCPDKNVINFNQFIEWCGFKPNYLMSKDKTIEIILNMQSKLDRPLMKKDFANPTQDSIGVGMIKTHWGSMNKMKEELGLIIVGADVNELMRPIWQLEKDIIKLCNNIKRDENRTIITYDDINNCDFTMNRQTYDKLFRDKLGMTLREYLQSIGFELMKSGSGLVKHYEDGEITSSQFEYAFTNYLRTNKFGFNSDYHRGVRYKTFVDNYSGLMDCDYVIKYKGRLIYIEIAGLLRDYKEWYLNDKPLNSKSKEKYRLKLKKKENMFKEYGLEYYILFPNDLNEDKYKEIFN